MNSRSQACNCQVRNKVPIIIMYISSSRYYAKVLSSISKEELIKKKLLFSISFPSMSKGMGKERKKNVQRKAKFFFLSNT